jgi:hypothetical protein
MADLDVSIQRKQESLDATPQDDPDRAGQLQSLGIGYSIRYERTKAMADLNLAIQRHQEVLDATPQDDPNRADHLQDLGVRYSDRYEKTGAMADLDISIQQSKIALMRRLRMILIG